MLLKFTVNNFKSLINGAYEPGPVNLVVGANNSGKTNLCQAMRFLSQTAGERKSLFDAWQEVKGMRSAHVKNVYFAHPTIDLGCSCNLSIDGKQIHFDYALSLEIAELSTGSAPGIVKAERLTSSGGKSETDKILLIENSDGKARIFNEEALERGKPVDNCYEDIVTKTNSTMLSLLYDERANAQAIAFRDYLSSWQHYDLDPHRLREDRFEPSATMLAADGGNLSSALFNLKNRDERRYRQLIALAQRLEKRLDALNFTIAGERISMEITDKADHRLGLANASSGTLRYIALCYIFLNRARQNYPSLAIIEEPENGLYVRYLKPLFELLDSTKGDSQYIFTSHAPYFIDLFEDRLENVVLMQDKGTYSALIQIETERARQYLEEMPLGELHFREMLA
jgi:predicted ATPase